MLLRFYLSVMGYPSIGGEKYHIAHMLWGGVLMVTAFVLNFAFLGNRIQRMVALLGGVGFGVFIDEIGKFITRDNDYFFRPSVGIIYAIFVVLYITTTFLTREQKLTSEEYQLNALRSLEEAIHHDMDRHERSAARQLLSHARQSDVLTQRLHALLYEVPVVPPAQSKLITRWRKAISEWYERMWQARSSRVIVRVFFVAQSLFFMVAVLATVYNNIDQAKDFFAGRSDYGHSLVMGQLFSSVIAAVFVLFGVRWLRRSRLRAFEWFRRATLLNLLLTEFFMFSRVQFGAMPSFIFNLALLTIINVVIAEEARRTQA